MSELYLIRHGQASFGAANYDRLSPIGVRQADILADHLAGLEIGLDAFYRGELDRQIKTAQPTWQRYSQKSAHMAEPVILPALNEYPSELVLRAQLAQDPPEGKPASIEDFPGQDPRAFQAYFARAIHLWADGHFGEVPGLETWLAFTNRVTAALKHIMQRHGRGQRVAIFTSGGPISAALQMVLGLSNNMTVELAWQVMNASLTCIKYSPKGLALVFFNNTTHLLIAKDASLLTYR